MAGTRRRISRSEILQGAAGIFDSGVYSDLTVDSLARALHMSKSTLYKHFASKEDLIVAVVEQTCQLTDEDVRGAEQVLRRGDLASLDALIGLVARHAARTPRALSLQSHRLPAVCRDRIELTTSLLGRYCVDILRKGAANGTLSVAHPDLAAASLMAACAEATACSARGDINMGREDAVHAVFALFQPGLTA